MSLQSVQWYFLSLFSDDDDAEKDIIEHFLITI